MTLSIALVGLLVSALVLTLLFSKYPPDLVFLGALALTMVLPFPSTEGWKIGILTPAQALSGFANTGMLTVAFLYVVAAGVRETGAVDRLVEFFLGQPKTARGALGRLLPATSLLSGFMNNPPLVAVLVGPVSEWGRRNRISPSQLLLPLSFAAILGGMLTLLGTSTNLIVSGLAQQTLNLHLSLFSISPVGVPCALMGIIFLVLFGAKLIPPRSSAAEKLSDPREYTAELIVSAGSPLDNKSVEEGGLRHLPGAYLTDVIRDDGASFAVTPETILHSGDRLIFAGVVKSILQLHRLPGLEPATDQVFKLDSQRYNRRLFEAVVSASSPLVQTTIREGRFRNRYGAVVLAIARDGQRVEGQLGEVELKGGDTLLLEARPSFAVEYGDSRDFLLLNALHDSEPRRQEKAPVAILLLLGMVVLGGLSLLPLVAVALLAAMGMVITRCCSVDQARRAVDWSVLAVIACAIGISQAVEVSDLSGLISSTLLSVGGGSALVGLVGIYLATWVLTEILTNNAAAVLIFPIAVDLATQLGLPVAPVLVLVMVAASSSFLSPFGYQTNLMVYGPGGYRVGDYARVGLPLGILVGVTAVGVTRGML